MQYADDQVLSFTLDPTGRIVEFTAGGGTEADVWTLPLIGWAVVSQPSGPTGGAHTSLEPVVLQDDQFAVTVSHVLSTLEALVAYRIRHRT